MNAKYRFSKFLSIFIILGLIFSNAVSAAHAQEGEPPTPEPVATDLPPTEPPTTGAALIEGQAWSQSGWFSIIWGDGSEGETQTIYTLTDDAGQTTVLVMDEALAQSLGGALSFDRKYVSVEGVSAAPSSDLGASTIVNVSSISLAPAPGAEAQDEGAFPAVTGNKPWISIMCKFSDYATEPKNLAYFNGMYANSSPGLDHYWREQSYNLLNVAGSGAFGWVWLPHTEIYYNPTLSSGGTDLSLLANDCIAAANASVYYPSYSGINMMFNTNFDRGWAWGGSRYMTLDGVTRTWSTTWEPPWAYGDISVIQHEMGHGFGLPHSSGQYGATYDNAWDVMSQDRYNCTYGTYGCVAQGTISYHKHLEGWIPSGQIFTPAWGSTTTISLEQLAQPATSNYLMAKIPIGGSSTHYYTVETRRLVGYDIKLAGAAVIIHEVDTTRSRPAQVLDVDLNGVTSDAGAMWTVGETFSDATNKIYVTVVSALTTGFQVRIQLGPRKTKLADFNGNGTTDVSIFRPSNGVWYIKDQFVVQHGGNGDIPVPGDYNGDGTTDVAVFRPSNGMWYVNGQFSVQYGGAGDIPVPGDYNGDGTTDVAIFRPSNGMWYVNGQFSAQYGGSGDVPVPGDYNGNGTTDVAIFRPSNGMWYVNGQFSVQYGGAGDVPVPGDYNGDGTIDVAVFRPSNGMWYVNGQFSAQYGGAGDVPVPGDYNGDGTTDVAIFRPSNGMWYVNGQFSAQYGGAGDFPAPSRDTNGDGDPYQDLNQ